MIGNFFASISKFLMRNKILFWTLLSCVIAVLSIGVSRLKIDNDIYSIFPKGEEFQQFSKVIQENNLNKQLVFSFKASEDEDENFDRLDNLAADVEKHFSNEITNLQVYRMVDQSVMIDYLQNASIAFLTEEDYLKASTKVNNDSIKKQLENVKTRLTGANSVFLGGYFAKDPLNILGSTLNQFNVRSDSSAYTVENGVVYSSDKQKVFFFADLTVDSKDNEGLSNFDKKLSAFSKKLDASFEFETFGVYQIALANSQQIQKDTFLTSIISVSLILLLLVLYYRSVVVPFFFLLPAGFGVLSGLGLTGFINPEINAISIATASVLLGIVLDYAFHFYTHYKHSGSLLDTVREISTPMLVGSFTTVAAFAALLFTQSIVLKNFGLIALFTLLGAALFTVIALPVILQSTGLKIKNLDINKKEKSTSKLVFRIALLGVVALTTFSLLKSQGLNFDGDLNNLSFHPEELKSKEKSFTGINPETQKRLYLFSNGESLEKSKNVAYKLYQLLEQNKVKYQVSEIISPAPYMISKDLWEFKEGQWLEFWKENKEVEDLVIQNAVDLGFSEQAFSPFIESIENKINIQSTGEELTHQLGMSRLINSQENHPSLLTSIIVSKSTVDDLKSEIRQLDDVYIMDVSEIASGMLTTVKSDFNFLLFFSSSIVFLSLLVVYGRIELALFAFFPMLLSWIWIMGVTSFFDIKFNFVNIILTTFIFGLGDDFSIFMTDGLIQKYKTKKDSLTSYKSAIILSGITTIIGTGTLILAKHPSIQSIALVSIIGISAIMIITLYVQPGIFNWFVTRRVEKRRGPITFFTLIFSLLLFTYFFIGSLFLTIFLLLIVLPFPAKKVKKQMFMNFLISKLAKSTLYAGFHVKKIMLDKDKLDFSKPSIIVANHTSFLDILAVLMLNPKVIIMVKSWVYNSPVFGPFIRYAGYIFVENGTETNLQLVKQKIDEGYSLVIFPEGTRSKDGEIHRFHKGAFLLSKALDVPIQPLLLVGLNQINPKNDIMINAGEFYIQPLDKVYPDSQESDKEYTKRIQLLMRNAFVESKKKNAKTSFWYSSIMRNYILKGPVLEWYVRMKFKLEKKNFEQYDDLIDDRRVIYDIGCGYGYLSYYLHYRNINRTVIGVDYDVEKVETADNSLKKNNNIRFQIADIKQFDFHQSDVVFFNDVLHYLPKVEQTKLLDKACKSLNSNGILFIRDGVLDFNQRAKKTKLTERLSTKFFKFNKVENDLEFLNISDIKDFATENKLTFEMIEHSKTTSNVLFILRKDNC